LLPRSLDSIYTKTQEWVISDLESRNLMFKSEMTSHSYPFCYRCGYGPLLQCDPLRGLLISKKLKPDLIAQNERVHRLVSRVFEKRTLRQGTRDCPGLEYLSLSLLGYAYAYLGRGENWQIRVIGSVPEELIKQWATGKLPPS
jgi:hypothetical protein